MGKEDRAKPKYALIYSHYKERIASRALAEGERLPAESEICRAFGVSRITVAKALNTLAGEGYVRRVQGGGTYVSARRAQGANGNGGGAAIVSYIATFNPFGREIDLIRGVEAVAQVAGFLLTVSNTDEDPKAEREILSGICETARGIILYPARGIQNTDLYYRLIEDGYPIVFIDHAPFGVPCSFVASANREGGYAAGKELVALGVGRALLVFHRLDEFSSELERHEGIVEALAEGGLRRADVRTQFIKGMAVDAACERALAWLLHGYHSAVDSGAPPCLFCCNAVVAAGILAHLRGRGVALPAGLVVAAFDDITQHPEASNGFRTLSVLQNHYAMGEQAGRLLLEKIQNGANAHDRKVRIPVEIALRNDDAHH